MNTVVALLSLLRLGHLPFLRPRLMPRTPALPRVAASMQIQRNVVKCLYFRDAPPSITLLQPSKNAPMWRNVEELISPPPLRVLPRSMTSFFAM
jgi:hypothetical protein